MGKESHKTSFFTRLLFAGFFIYNYMMFQFYEADIEGIVKHGVMTILIAVLAVGISISDSINKNINSDEEEDNHTES